MFESLEKLEEHFQRHGRTMGYATAQDYLQGALMLIDAYEGVMRHIRSDGATLYYRDATTEFAILRPNGIVATYYRASTGIKYWHDVTGGEWYD